MADNVEKPIHYEVETEYGRLVCDYYPSAQLVQAFDRYFDRDLATSPERSDFPSRVEEAASQSGVTREQAEQTLRSLHQASFHLHTGGAMQEFIHGLPSAISNALTQWFEFSKTTAKIQYEGSGLRMGDIAVKYPGIKKSEAVESSKTVIDLARRQRDEALDWRYAGGDALRRLSSYYYSNLDSWKDAKGIYKRNSSEPHWRKWIKDKYNYFPDDLIEWLSFSAQSELSGGIFPGLSEDARERLDKKLISEGYRLSTASLITLEHAARMCGAPPYSYSLSHLKNTRSAQDRILRKNENRTVKK